jgi:hypothetical protein
MYLSTGFLAKMQGVGTPQLVGCLHVFYSEDKKNAKALEFFQGSSLRELVGTLQFG